ncbi:hypothetical protein BCV70DRAFT_110463 [Testicularia cyperi]|uniref:Uncharacterized protein n=1 Tax=Testicularia cyperi TaxID=1882483 RepID=A0A317XMT6_9BASI|nr:hypothetical protein BCV70DRAFT_110463 [Testicularia cyperi]
MTSPRRGKSDSSHISKSATRTDQIGKSRERAKKKEGSRTKAKEKKKKKKKKEEDVFTVQALDSAVPWASLERICSSMMASNEGTGRAFPAVEHAARPSRRGGLCRPPLVDQKPRKELST